MATSRSFSQSVKEALRTIAEGGDERDSMFSVDLGQNSGGLDRLSAYLHLFHHQVQTIAICARFFVLIQGW